MQFDLRTVNDIGRCTYTGVEVYEVESRYPKGHVLRGCVRGLKRGENRMPVPRPEAMKITLLLTSGNQMDITVHQEQVQNALNDLPGLWRRIQEGFAFELYKAGVLNVEQVDTPQQVEQRKKTLCKIFREVPLGPLCIEPRKH